LDFQSVIPTAISFFVAFAIPVLIVYGIIKVATNSINVKLDELDQDIKAIKQQVFRDKD